MNQPVKWGGRPQQLLRQRVLDEEDICWLCRQPVDKTLSGKTSWGPSVDHRVPRSKGGTNDRSNLSLAHTGCNSRKKDKLTAPQPRRRSRNW